MLSLDTLFRRAAVAVYLHTALQQTLKRTFITHVLGSVHLTLTDLTQPNCNQAHYCQDFLDNRLLGGMVLKHTLQPIA